MANNNKFYKISYENFKNEILKFIDNKNVNVAKEIYDNIILPKRATKFSAGYDFFSPIDFVLKPGETIKIPTGIRVSMNDDLVLLIFPRSSLGFKYRLQLDNTVGVIDADYFNADNEGHIFVKLTNDSKDKILEQPKNQAICQGIFIKYYLTNDDEVDVERKGGLGSTNVQ